MLSSTFWRNRRVFVTGHTGFKGAWLCILLGTLGARVHGVSRDIPTQPSLFEVAKVGEIAHTEFQDIRDLERMRALVRAAAPEIVIHAAAQSLVREGYRDPLETFETNVIGTANVLESVRDVPSVRVVVVVTTDKCYENIGDKKRFKEDDRLGGSDPYSSSKACAEILTHAMRESFFPPASYSSHRVAIATVRAGNVIGGGDWAKDRLIPDIIQALMSEQEPQIRNPDMVRPWQHVLDPLHGYLLLAEKLWSDGTKYSGAWNFGPDEQSEWPVRKLANRLCVLWGGGAKWKHTPAKDTAAEAFYLTLDSSKARENLGWLPRIDMEAALSITTAWYMAVGGERDARAVSEQQISEYFTSVLTSNP